MEGRGRGEEGEEKGRRGGEREWSVWGGRVEARGGVKEEEEGYRERVEREEMVGEDGKRETYLIDKPRLHPESDDSSMSYPTHQTDSLTAPPLIHCTSQTSSRFDLNLVRRGSGQHTCRPRDGGVQTQDCYSASYTYRPRLAGRV